MELIVRTPQNVLGEMLFSSTLTTFCYMDVCELLQVVRQSRASASSQEPESSYRGILHLMLIPTSKCSQSEVLLSRSTMPGSWWRRKLGWDTKCLIIIPPCREICPSMLVYWSGSVCVFFLGTSHSCGWPTRSPWSTWRSGPTWSSWTTRTPRCSHGSV